MKRFIYIFIIVAFLDTFVQLPIITPFALSLGASYAFTGAIVAIYSLTNMLGNVLGGHWIDQWGRKKMLMVSILLIIGILLLYPLAHNAYTLFMIRFLHGLAGGVLIPAAFAYVGDLTEQKTRGKSMAYAGASIGIAAIIGPAIGGIMAAKISIPAVFLLIALLFSLSFIYLVVLGEDAYQKRTSTTFTLQHYLPLIKNRGVLFASFAAFLLMVSNGTLAYAFPLKTEALSLSASATGIYFSLFGITALVVFLTPINQIFDRLSSYKLILVGLMFVAFSMILLHLFTHQLAYFVTMIIYGLGFSFIFPSMNKIVTESTIDEDRGKAFGIFYAFFSLGVVFGAFISGLVTQYWPIPFLISAIILLVGLFGLIKIIPLEN